MSATNVNTETTTLFSDLFFSMKRHNLITMAAEGLLSNSARARITSIISPLGLRFGKFGEWADKIKSSPPPNDDQTRRFLQDDRNQSHRRWHYVNLPLGVNSYAHARQLGFTRSDDVVQTIRKCVLVLRGNSTRFSRVNALRLLGHMVGDVHQPLHVGCGFVDGSGSVPRLVTDPEIILERELPSDTGGNDILLPSVGSMHSYWDGDLGGNLDVDDVTPTSGPSGLSSSTAALEEKVVNDLRAGAEALPSSGLAGISSALPIERRAEEWADESLEAAREAYRNIVIVARQGNDFRVSWEGVTTAAGKGPYDARCAPILLDRMRKGVRRLADLLNDIYP